MLLILLRIRLEADRQVDRQIASSRNVFHGFFTSRIHFINQFSTGNACEPHPHQRAHTHTQLIHFVDELQAPCCVRYEGVRLSLSKLKVKHFNVFASVDLRFIHSADIV